MAKKKVNIHTLHDEASTTHDILLAGESFHTVLETTVFQPTYCEACDQFIWGVKKQCLRCTDCGLVIHKKCLDKLVASGFNQCAKKKNNSTLTRRFKATKTDFARSAVALDIEEDLDTLVITSRSLRKTNRVAWPLRQTRVISVSGRRDVKIGWGLKTNTFTFETAAEASDFKTVLRSFLPGYLVPSSPLSGAGPVANIDLSDIEPDLSPDEQVMMQNLKTAFERGLMDLERYDMERKRLLANALAHRDDIVGIQEPSKIVDEPFIEDLAHQLSIDTVVMHSSKESLGITEDRAILSSKESLETSKDPFIKDLAHLPIETVAMKTYSWEQKRWTETKIQIRLDYTEPFASGAMRNAYKMQVLSRPVGQQSCVGKVWQEQYMMCDKQGYYIDVEMQALCQSLADAFNKHAPPKEVRFVDTFLIERLVPGLRDEERLVAVEPYLKGEYHKYTSNTGYIGVPDRNTPQAFSHYTYHHTQGQIMVVDMQGVGDLYTDPQVHTITGQGYGLGNWGREGMATFFATHQCNSVCRYLGLGNVSSFCDAGNTIVCTTSPKRLASDIWKRDKYSRVLQPIPDSASLEDLSIYRLKMEQYNKLCEVFNQFKDKETEEVDSLNFLPMVESLQFVLNQTTLQDIVDNVDTDGNGAVSWMEFLCFWCGIEKPKASDAALMQHRKHRGI